MRSRAFSNLVADNQYSALGLMLLGALARVKSILGRLMVEQGIHVGLLETAETIEDEGQPAQEEVAIADAGCDDFGELVDREEIIGDIEGHRENLNEEGDGEVAEEVINQAATEKKARLKKRIGPSTDMDEGLAKGESRPSKPPKKKRKKGDAFDDLFDILI
jgi:ribonuclease MRP protein subunit RMP1